MVGTRPTTCSYDAIPWLLCLNIEGEAVGLMMSGQPKSSLNFLLPPYYPQMVIETLAAGRTIPRGTIQVKWTLQALHESKRYGLPAEWDNKMRGQEKANAIVAEAVLEGSPAHGKIEAGDILLEVDQKLQVNLWRLSMYEDNHIDRKVNEIFHGIVSLHLFHSADVDGCGTGQFIRTGLLLEHGLVVTRRGNSSWVDQVKITLSAGTEVRAHIIFMHEAVDFTFIKYNTADVPQGLDLKPASLSERRLKEGDGDYLASFDNAEKKVDLC
ncbi:trypsin-like protein [Diaporthe amygdali]|uniref:trypsin-like protein n=1 Tax=Phomopsis amygdali TaxID=1214568 RepID=UPI0022FED334|nr:trypsin-like protein [Diaporthe amygdali]KAJ0123549.1 trypsin-like protein [Diaporthe amygdali]